MPKNPFDEPNKRISQDALSYFTDRVSFIEAFQNYVDAPAAEPLKVLVFCGVGGIGKTTLVHKLIQDLHAAKTPFPHARFDLDTVKDPLQAYREVLVRLRTDLGHFKIDFARFDLCLALMLAGEGGAAPNLVQINPTLNSVYQFALSLSPIPFTGAIAALSGHVAKMGARHVPGFEDWIRRAGGTEDVIALRKRAQSDDQTLPGELMKRFAEDLKTGLPARADKAVRGVLFLDTYERLWVGRAADGSQQSRDLDEWVRGLAGYCLHSGVLLVVTGRDRLRWEKDEPDEWGGWLDQHQMGGLSAPDAQAFLSKCGIGADSPAPPTPLQQAILHCADENAQPTGDVCCHTLFLALCAEIVLNTRRQTSQDPPAETFHRIPPGAEARELADRFLKSLHDRPMEMWLEELSLTPRFDKEAALALRGSENRHDAEAAWDLLTGFSFAQPQPDGFWHLHQSMRDALALRVSEDAARRVHTLLRDHWATHGDAALAFFHRWLLDPAGTLGEWNHEYEVVLREQGMLKARQLLTWWSDIPLGEAEHQVLGDVLWAETHGVLGDALSTLSNISPNAALLTAALKHYQAAMSVYSENKFPWEWAGVQYEVARIYQDLPTGSRATNLLHSMDCCRAVLRVYTKDRFPKKWARIQTTLGQNYVDLVTGDRAVNLHQAILCFEAALSVCISAKSSAKWAETWASIWAQTQVSLGLAYSSLPTGDRTLNLQRAMAYYQAALQVSTKDQSPAGWAGCQHNIGNVYSDLPTGDRAVNLRKAIDHYEMALSVLSEDDSPNAWAGVQLSLGVAYQKRPTGNRAADLQRSIAHYQASARVFTEEEAPWHWAGIQHNLGLTYSIMPSSDHSVNLESAIASYQAALRVRTETDFPREWAATQYEMGTAYHDLSTGDRYDNLTKSARCFEAALRVYTEVIDRTLWTETQNRFALTLVELAQETQFIDFAMGACECFEAAERGYTASGLNDKAAEAKTYRTHIEAVIKQAKETSKPQAAE